ncbi:MAG: hypothetical protein KKH61_21125 [Gammaproteobacteria bacterium]|nr:hypothetical protein [Gammaproteobacteria bacterium]
MEGRHAVERAVHTVRVQRKDLVNVGPWEPWAYPQTADIYFDWVKYDHRIHPDDLALFGIEEEMKTQPDTNTMEGRHAVERASKTCRIQLCERGMKFEFRDHLPVTKLNGETLFNWIAFVYRIHPDDLTDSLTDYKEREKALQHQVDAAHEAFKIERKEHKDLQSYLAAEQTKPIKAIVKINELQTLLAEVHGKLSAARAAFNTLSSL